MNGHDFKIDDSETGIEKVYLDYNATTPLDKPVAEAISEALLNGWANPSGQYQRCKEIKQLINRSRKQVANMINASSADIIFTSGGTEANNLVFHSVLKNYEKLRQQKSKYNLPHMIISKIEHDSVKLIAENYEKENLAEITQINVDKSGAFKVKDVIDSIKENTVLISIMLANNETGVIQPVKELVEKIKKLNLSHNRQYPLYVHTDAAQAVGKIKVDIDELQVDYLTIVGHKFYGPRIGALYARDCLNQHNGVPIVHNFFGASSQENGLRPGTENTPMIIGLGKAAEMVTKNLEKYSNHMRDVRDYLENRLKFEFGTENIRFNGSSSFKLPNTCNVSFLHSQNLRGYAVLGNAKILEASTGSCCHSGNLKASSVLLSMGIDKFVASNAIRLSVGRETTKSQIDLIIEDLKQSVNGLLGS